MHIQPKMLLACWIWNIFEVLKLGTQHQATDSYFIDLFHNHRPFGIPNLEGQTMLYRLYICQKAAGGHFQSRPSGDILPQLLFKDRLNGWIGLHPHRGRRSLNDLLHDHICHLLSGQSESWRHLGTDGDYHWRVVESCPNI